MGASSRIPASIAAGLGVVLATARAFADQVDVPAERDTTIFEESGATSNGAGDYLFAGQTNGSKARRALIRFDVGSAIPAGSTITSATLSLHCSQTKAGAETVAIHRALAQWGEATSNATQEEGKGAAAAPGDATWTHASYPATSWIAGGSFAATTSATTPVGAENASYTWVSNAMTSDVQRWLDVPAANFGWMIVLEHEDNMMMRQFEVVAPPGGGGDGGVVDGAADGCSCREGATSTTSSDFAALFAIGALALAALARRFTSVHARLHNVQSPSCTIAIHRGPASRARNGFTAPRTRTKS
jgi:hypothetical protein